MDNFGGSTIPGISGQKQILMRHWALILVIFSCLVSCKSSKDGMEFTPGEKNRVIGYILSHDHKWKEAMDTIGWDKISDLNLAFLNPDENGNFPDGAYYQNLTSIARSRGVRIFFSVGGGEPPVYMADLIKPDRRDQFAKAIADFAYNNNFDGADIDLENSLINDDYAPFIAAVRKELSARQKLMTAALASWNANLIHDTTLAKFDAIHIMSYDKTGPWRPDVPGQHSPYTMAVDDFNYFHQARGQAASKLSIGLPFYGYGFGPGAPSGLTFGAIASQYPQSVNDDTVNVAGGGTIYYNGKETIRKKARLAKQVKANGVMIWQIAGDAKSPNSLLDVIQSEN